MQGLHCLLCRYELAGAMQHRRGWLPTAPPSQQAVGRCMFLLFLSLPAAVSQPAPAPAPLEQAGAGEQQFFLTADTLASIEAEEAADTLANLDSYGAGQVCHAPHIFDPHF